MRGLGQLKKIWHRLNKRGVVLMYHRISKSGFDPRRLRVSPANFEEHLQIIKKYGSAVQMQEMGKNLKSFFFGSAKIVITLDDSYADNFYNAAAILKRYDIPATFFLITGSIGSREEFFWDGLERTILAPSILPEIFDIVINDKQYRWQIMLEGPCQRIDYAKAIKTVPPNDVKLSRFQLYSALNHIMGPLATEKRQNGLKHLERWSGQTLTVRPDSLPMSFDDLKSLANCPLFEIGAHSVSHPRLSALPLERQEKEIAQSKQDLENLLNQPIVSFSYPHGSYSDETVRLVERLKFQNACTVIPGLVMRKTNPYLLPRFSVEDWNGDKFEQNLRNWLR